MGGGKQTLVEEHRHSPALVKGRVGDLTKPARERLILKV